MTPLSTARAARTTAAAGYRLPDVVRMEWLKLHTVRAPRWITLVVVVSVVGTGIAVLWYYPAHWTTMTAASRAGFDPTNDGFTGVAIAQLAAGIAGVLAITSEYSSGSIRSTLAAIPNRPLLLAGKALAFGLPALIISELTCVTAFCVDQYLVLRAPAPHAALTDPAALRAVLMLGAYLALIGLVGLGIGAIVRHTAGAIAVTVGVVFVLPAVFKALPASWHDVARYLPMLIAENSVGAVKPVAHSLSPWSGMAALCLYAAVSLAIGGWQMARRDA